MALTVGIDGRVAAETTLRNQERGQQLGDAGIHGSDRRRFSHPLGIETRMILIKTCLGAAESCQEAAATTFWTFPC
jgi:hypothetical protein